MDNDNKPIKPQKNSLAVWLIGGLALLVAAIGAFYFVVKDRMDVLPFYFAIFAFIILVIIILGITVIVKFKKGEIAEQEPDYRVFFIIGVSWIPLGIATDNPGFIGAGVIFMIIGLANKDKWRQQAKWKEMPRGMKQVKLALMALLGIMVLLGILFYFFKASGIN